MFSLKIGEFLIWYLYWLFTFIPSRARKLLYDRHNTHLTNILNIKTNRMKKIILFAFLVTTVLMSQASVISNSNTRLKPGFSIGKSTVGKFNKIETIKSPGNVSSAENCTVTMKGSINGGVFTIEVGCTATASTCDQAASKATSCLSAAIRKARQSLS